jgi:hypothetical protein
MVKVMDVLLASNEPVRLSFVLMLLRDAGFAPVILDQHMAAVEGSAGAIQRRIVVPADQVAAARAFLREAGEL